MSLFNPPKVLAALNREQRIWPSIFSTSRHGTEASVPDALASANEHIEEAIKGFAALADDHIPRGKDAEVKVIVEALEEAKREVRESRMIFESLWQLFRPRHQRPKKDD